MQHRYRGWDTVKKVMYSADEMGRDELTLNPDGRGFVHVSSQGTQFSQYFNHIVPLQFTGLKDKNGVEIYDADLVEARGLVGWVRFVVDLGSWQVCHKRGNVIAQLAKADIKVVGNKYENTDLYEQTEEKVWEEILRLNGD